MAKYKLTYKNGSTYASFYPTIDASSPLSQNEAGQLSLNIDASSFSITDNKLVLNDITTESTIFSKDITLKGGEWSDAVKKVYTNGTVPKGESLQSFFEKMLCKELWGAPGNVDYSFTASVSAPSITASKSGRVPVGTVVSFGATAGTMSTDNHAKVSGYTYGYSLDGLTISSAQTSYSADVTTPSQSGSVVLDCTVNDKLLPTSSVDGSRGATKSYYVCYGTGTYTASETGKTVSRGTLTDASLYNVSNMENISTEQVINITNEAFKSATQASIIPVNSASASVTGYYPVYFGGLSETDATSSYFTESVIKALDTVQESIPSSVSTASGVGTFAIAIPSDRSEYNKSSLKMTDSKGMSFGSSSSKTLTITLMTGVTVNYKVFFISNSSVTTSAASWNITFE